MAGDSIGSGRPGNALAGLRHDQRLANVADDNAVSVSSVDSQPSDKRLA